MLLPKIVTTLQQGYTLRQFRSDVISGIIVGIVALPLAIAFAIASGVAPEKGLITAVIAGFLISAFGGSRVQIGGPTGAFVVIVYGIVHKYGIEGLVAATFMGGVILVIFGAARLGGVIKFIPRPVTVGFTSGIAVVIFVSQLKDFLGLNIERVPADFFEKVRVYFENIHSLSYPTLLVGMLTVSIILLWQRFVKKIPGTIIAMVFVTLIVNALKFPVATIGSAFGNIPSSLPKLSFPHFSFAMARDLVSPAFTIALLAGIESLLSAVVADGMIGAKHRSNMELVAQGIANIGSSLFGGMPATGAIARTAVNVHNGGRTPVAGITHAFVLLLIMVLFAPWAKLVPLACLAGILMIVAYRMAEWHSFAMILRAPKSDILVLLATFFLTVIIDLTVAIQIGMVLAAFLLIYRLSETASIRNIMDIDGDEEEECDFNSISRRDVPEGVEVFEVQGPFFFGMISSFQEAVQNIEKQPKVRVIRMRHALSIDETGINALRQAYRFCRRNSIAFILSGVHSQPLFALERCGLLKEIGEENIFGNIDDALNCARSILGLPLQPRLEPFIPTVKRDSVENAHPPFK